MSWRQDVMFSEMICCLVFVFMTPLLAFLQILKSTIHKDVRILKKPLRRFPLTCYFMVVWMVNSPELDELSRECSRGGGRLEVANSDHTAGLCAAHYR